MRPFTPSPTTFHAIDRAYHAWQGRLTGGLSPSALGMAYTDWGWHLLNSPGKQAELLTKAARKGQRYAAYAAQRLAGEQGCSCIVPLPQDHRFDDPRWQELPYAFYYQSFLLLQQWWHNATTEIHGVSPHHQNVVAFAARQWLDMFSPSNFLPTNPEVLGRTLEERGANLLRGWHNFIEDWSRQLTNRKPAGLDDYRVGENLAATPGQVVFRNRLMELIQYAPTTEKVQAEPILIVPAWIMKYYILDLSAHNSMVRYLLDQGHTVYMISWKNPTAEDRDLGMEDYLRLGVLRALEQIRKAIPDQRIHAVGYCLGGTLLSIAAAALGRDRRDWLASVTLLAAQTDFTEAGELMLFIDPAQVAFLEDLMWEQGYLDTEQMVGAFQMLRSNDLIWSRIVHDYLMGERSDGIDLMAWNADATRMPFRMHSEYLRRLFLDNDLAEGRYRVDDERVAVSDIRVPIFAVGTEKDHVAPWRSVYKINLLADAPVTFCLTNGGHNAGIVSEPGHHHRRHRIATRQEGEPYRDPDEWLEQVAAEEGSWWPAWEAWLRQHGGDVVPARELPQRSLGAAPGKYVLAP